MLDNQRIVKSRVCVVDRAVCVDVVVDLVAELVDRVHFGAVEPRLFERLLRKSLLMLESVVGCKRSRQLSFVLHDFVFVLDVASDVVAVDDVMCELALLDDGLLASDVCLLSVS